MIELVTGGSASGKSAYAEALVTQSGIGWRYYIATMRPWGEEGRARVEKHRAMRSEKCFLTIECYTGLEALRLRQEETDGQDDGDGCAVLLECMSNLLANEQFEAGGTDGEILARVERGICALAAQARLLVIVTNEIFSDGCAYEAETGRYIRLLGQLNVRLAALADRVTEVVFGIPVPVAAREMEGEKL